ncbi:hypothetical protein [Mycolicibacterium aubagnense]|uniref:Uncharacterized protein n=1 Tax=Mycolicibacterium aubagnense TaxID=319707 RepID=A0ABM7I6J7_9MYCO|nr:hypothetical protein [Mycolicibacterium aubagnense]TLH64434.1 hypothetical protein C1S80_12170 [Mycolicibacterium aubagnense]BBX82166.1 hypothetical protein MAUB_00390 [Mycolicibacterium aubagnense]
MSERYDDSQIPDLSEIGGHWDPRQPAHHQGAYVVPGRRVARIPGRQWPHTPEECSAGHTDTEWILDGQVLLCTGCGIDGT